MKKAFIITISILVFVAGLGLMFYPSFSNWMHERTASYAITDYMVKAGSKNDDEYAAEFDAARVYNATLSGDIQSFLDAKLNEENDYENPDYWNTLDEVDGIMGVIVIPEIDVSLPIYHGTDESALQKGAGHLEGSALPTGDVGNHTIITGHTGLPSAMLFTDLDELIIGDYFYLDILNEVFTYEIRNIYVVLPSDKEQLAVQKDKDLVTLVTCTPYGINSHRLLLQGERIENNLNGDTENSAADQVHTSLENRHTISNSQLIILAAIFCLVVFAVLFGFYIIKIRRTKNENNQNDS